MAHTSIFLPGKSHGQRSLARYSPWGHKESETDEWLSTHTHTHSSQVRKVIWWVPRKNIAGAHRSVIYFWIFKIHWFLPSSKYSDLYATIIKMSIYIWWLCAMSAWLRWNRTAKNSLFPGYETLYEIWKAGEAQLSLLEGKHRSGVVTAHAGCCWITGSCMWLSCLHSRDHMPCMNDFLVLKKQERPPL